MDLRGFRGRTQRRRHLVLEHLSGRRCDVESIYYSYSFDEALQQEWTWSQRFAPQAEILSYIEHVADRFDLRKHFTFDTRVVGATWNAADRLWEVRLDNGETRRSRYLISGAGGLSTPKDFDLPGLGNFTGLQVSTSRWNISLDDLEGKRVAVIGTGSSGVQAIPLIAEVAEHVTVFQRTPNYVMPARNTELSTEQIESIKVDYPAIREECRHSPGGIPDRPVADKAFDVSEEERRRRYEAAYERSGFQGVGAEFADLLTDARRTGPPRNFSTTRSARSSRIRPPPSYWCPGTTRWAPSAVSSVPTTTRPTTGRTCRWCRCATSRWRR